MLLCYTHFTNPYYIEECYKIAAVFVEWYKESTAVIAKYQAESVQEEQERERLKKQETLKELEPEIKQLKVN